MVQTLKGEAKMTLLFYNRHQGKGEFYNIIDA